MRHEVKISLPFYKVSYAAFFIMLLSLVRGVTYSYEIGIAVEAPMAVLAACVLADTYTKEITSGRSEIWRLYPVKKRMVSIYRRIVIQELFLLLASAIGYGLFFVFQEPRTIDMIPDHPGNETEQFLVYLAAVAATLCFWGLLSNFLSCLFRSMWIGIGSCLILWVITNSSVGDRYFGVWNLFSYTFRDVENIGDLRWIRGKIVCICISIVMTVILPEIIKKRG